MKYIYIHIHTGIHIAAAVYKLDVQLNHVDKPNNIFRSQLHTLKNPCLFPVKFILLGVITTFSKLCVIKHVSFL